MGWVLILEVGISPERGIRLGMGIVERLRGLMMLERV